MQHPSRANEVQYVVAHGGRAAHSRWYRSRNHARPLSGCATRVSDHGGDVADNRGRRRGPDGPGGCVRAGRPAAGDGRLLPSCTTSPRNARRSSRCAPPSRPAGRPPASGARHGLALVVRGACDGRGSIHSALSGLLRSLLFGSRLRSATYAAVRGIVLGVTGVAAALPAWRASRVIRRLCCASGEWDARAVSPAFSSEFARHASPAGSCRCRTLFLFDSGILDPSCRFSRGEDLRPATPLRRTRTPYSFPGAQSLQCSS